MRLIDLRVYLVVPCDLVIFVSHRRFTCYDNVSVSRLITVTIMIVVDNVVTPSSECPVNTCDVRTFRKAYIRCPGFCTIRVYIIISSVGC